MELNVIDFMFINFILIIAISSILLNHFEPYLPVFIVQTFRYGKHCYKGTKNSLASAAEVPKSWFKHFYIFALVWAWTAFIFVFKSAVFQIEPPHYVIKFLDIMAGGESRPITVNLTSSLIAISLLTTQCSKRFYETNYMQIFSSHSKINLSHYIVGYLHYFGSVVAILSNSDGFSKNKFRRFDFSEITYLHYFCILLFLYSCLYQYKSNLLLLNLRIDSKGKVTSENHMLPIGGYFERISSPHMLFEILMYVSILGIIPSSRTWRLITFWVVINQVENAWLTHKWYKENFKNYPKRYAVFPLIL